MYPGGCLTPQVMYSHIYRPKPQCNTSINYTNPIILQLEPEYIHYSLVAYVYLLAQGSIKIKIPNFQVQLCKRSEHYLLQLLNVSVLNFE